MGSSIASVLTIRLVLYHCCDITSKVIIRIKNENWVNEHKMPSYSDCFFLFWATDKTWNSVDVKSSF